MEYLNINIKDQIAEVIVNREPVNAINQQLADEINEAFHQLESDDNVRVVILRSELNVFVSGADIKMMKELQNNKETGRMLKYVKSLQDTLNFIENISKPTIAYINGHAMGGGLELGLACDFRIINENAKIGLPEVKLGLIPGAGGTQRLTRLIGETKAKEIIYFSKHLTAYESLNYGIVSKIVNDENGIDIVFEFARQLRDQAPIALAEVKRCIQNSGQQTLENGSEKEITATANVFNSEDARIGFTSFLEKKEPMFIGK